jgi:hypothetical protein
MAGLPLALPQGLTAEPRDHLHGIHRGGSQQRLEVCTCQPQIPTLTEVKAPDALRQATLDPCPQGILGFELGGFLPLAGGLDRLVVGLGPDRELARGAFRRGSRLTGGTCATGGAVKPDANHGIARDIVARSPVDAGLSLRTARLLRLPIQDKGLHVIALSALLWSAIGPKGGAHHIDVILGLCGDQAIGIHIAAVEQVGSRQQLPGS